jgi:hypothetical protein
MALPVHQFHASQVLIGMELPVQLLNATALQELTGMALLVLPLPINAHQVLFGMENIV